MAATFLGLAPVDVNLSASPSGCVFTCAVLFLGFLVLLFFYLCQMLCVGYNGHVRVTDEVSFIQTCAPS